MIGHGRRGKVTRSGDGVVGRGGGHVHAFTHLSTHWVWVWAIRRQQQGTARLGSPVPWRRRGWSWLCEASARSMGVSGGRGAVGANIPLADSWDYTAAAAARAGGAGGRLQQRAAASCRLLRRRGCPVVRRRMGRS